MTWDLAAAQCLCVEMALCHCGCGSERESDSVEGRCVFCLFLNKWLPACHLNAAPLDPIRQA